MSAALSAFFTVRTWSTLDLSAVFMFCYGIISIRDYKYNQTTYPPSLYWPYSSRSKQFSWPSAQEGFARLAATSTSKFQNLCNQRPNPKIWCDSANLDHGALPFPSDRRWGLSTEPDVVPERWISLSFQKSLYNHTIITPEGVAFLQLNIIHSRLVDERFHCGRKNQKSWFFLTPS